MMKRRAFLFACGSTAFAAGGGARLRIGQIGTEHAHAAGKMEAMRALTDLWEVVGVAAEKGYEGVPLMTEAQLLGTPDLKAVAVETRMEKSCETALRCIEAGKHVHLDKPGALGHEEFKAMRLEAEKRGLTVQMGYMLRYNPAFVLLFQAVREGWLGEITEIDAAMGKLGDAKQRGIIGGLPGGGMFELGCHVIDAVTTILGKPLAVSAFSTPTQGDGVKDNQMAVLQYAKATAVVRVNHADPFGGPRRRFNVTGTEGTFEILPMESGKVNLSLTKARGSYKKGTQSFQLVVPKDRYAGEFTDLAKVVRGEKKLDWDAAHDISVHETVLRAAGAWVVARDPTATMIVLPADHLIKDHAQFQRVLSNAALAAENSGSLVTVGITPTWPCPSYGYVERGRRASIGGLDDLPVWEVARFREKPNPDLAEHFISQGTFLWNAGMFIWTIPAIFSELSRHCPVLADFISELRGSKDFSATVDKQFGKLPKLSIDYALMERASRVLNIESTFDWDDVGNWTSVGRYLDTDSDGNQHNCALSQQEATNNIVFTQTGQHVALIGVQDLIVVASKDGLLVASRSKAENIKKIVDGLPKELR